VWHYHRINLPNKDEISVGDDLFRYFHGDYSDLDLQFNIVEVFHKCANELCPPDALKDLSAFKEYEDCYLEECQQDKFSYKCRDKIIKCQQGPAYQTFFNIVKADEDTEDKIKT
jgi:hypothetical protein